MTKSSGKFRNAVPAFEALFAAARAGGFLNDE
jgi:hypothetical protein